MEIGQRFHNLVLIEKLNPKLEKSGNMRYYAVFKCDCGNICTKETFSVRSSKVKNCRECGTKRLAKSKITHGESKSTLWRKWADMKKRCYNPNVDRYSNYGALGIKVCDEWKSDFVAFRDWCLQNGWKEGLQIDRIDVYGNYEPNNCRIVLASEQAFNKRNTIYVEIRGEKVCLIKILYEKGLGKQYKNILYGLKHGKTIEYFIDKLNF